MKAFNIRWLQASQKGKLTSFPRTATNKGRIFSRRAKMEVLHLESTSLIETFGLLATSVVVLASILIPFKWLKTPSHEANGKAVKAKTVKE